MRVVVPREKKEFRRLRRRLPPPPRGTSGEERPKDEPAPRSRRRLPRAQLLRRVFFVEALRCPRCATALVVLAIRPEDSGLDELPFVDEALPEHDPHAYDGNDVPEASAADADDEAPP